MGERLAETAAKGGGLAAERTLVVAGASGYLGRHVVQAASAQGWHVKALVRRAGAAEPAKGVEEVIATVTDPATLQGVCDGADAVISCLGITRQTDKVTYADIDYQANANVLREAERAGCRRFAYVSVFGAQAAIHTDMVAAKERFVSELMASTKLEWVIIRPTGFFSDMREFLDMAMSGRCYVLGDGTSRMNPIHGEDLANVCVDALSGEPNRQVPVGGPETFTWNEVCSLAFQAAGKPRRVTYLPMCLVKFVVAIIKPFSRRTWNIAAFMSSSGSHDFVAPAHGQLKLADFYREEATKLKEAS
mmetsp:Transcript_13450/g.42900  ORF Transcript_13450/g.42900 Transcript_13450/m.42900 type:complete len:305 (-) Transcript_13450:1278-2192(-)